MGSGRSFSFGPASGRFFVHGFAKNEQDNIRDDELAAFKLLAAELLAYDVAYDDGALAAAMGNGTLTEVVCHD